MCIDMTSDEGSYLCEGHVRAEAQLQPYQIQKPCHSLGVTELLHQSNLQVAALL